MSVQHIIVVGGGRRIFAAITAAEAGARVTLLERGPQLLSKGAHLRRWTLQCDSCLFRWARVRDALSARRQALIGAFKRFQASDTVAWFEARAAFKTGATGGCFRSRMIPQPSLSVWSVRRVKQEFRCGRTLAWIQCGGRRMALN